MISFEFSLADNDDTLIASTTLADDDSSVSKPVSSDEPDWSVTTIIPWRFLSVNDGENPELLKRLLTDDESSDADDKRSATLIDDVVVLFL